MLCGNNFGRISTLKRRRAVFVMQASSSLFMSVESPRHTWCGSLAEQRDMLIFRFLCDVKFKLKYLPAENQGSIYQPQHRSSKLCMCVPHNCIVCKPCNCSPKLALTNQNLHLISCKYKPKTLIKPHTHTPPHMYTQCIYWYTPSMENTILPSLPLFEFTRRACNTVHILCGRSCITVSTQLNWSR